MNFKFFNSNLYISGLSLHDYSHNPYTMAYIVIVPVCAACLSSLHYDTLSRE